MEMRSGIVRRRGATETVFTAGITVVFLVLLLVNSPPAKGQRETGQVNIGLQAGQPGGVTSKLYRSSPIAYSGLATTDGDDFFTVHLHRVQEHPLPDSLVYAYVGPGILVGGRELDLDPSPEAGVSIQAGLNFYAERFEVFLHVTPTLRFLPSVTPSVGRSVGLRYTLPPP